MVRAAGIEAAKRNESITIDSAGKQRQTLRSASVGGKKRASLPPSHTAAGQRCAVRLCVEIYCNQAHRQPAGPDTQAQA